MKGKMQKCGGDVARSPGDKIKSAKVHKANPKRLDSRGGSHMRGKGQ